MTNEDAVIAMAASVTERAHDLIEEGWVQGAYQLPNGQGGTSFCILGALQVAMGELFKGCQRIRAVTELAEMYILDEALAQHNFRGRSGRSIPSFNDASSRTKEHVLGVMRAAADRLWAVSLETEDVPGATIDLSKYTEVPVEERLAFMSDRLVAA